MKKLKDLTSENLDISRLMDVKEMSKINGGDCYTMNSNNSCDNGLSICSICTAGLCSKGFSNSDFHNKD